MTNDKGKHAFPSDGELLPIDTASYGASQSDIWPYIRRKMWTDNSKWIRIKFIENDK